MNRSTKTQFVLVSIIGAAMAIFGAEPIDILLWLSIATMFVVVMATNGDDK